MSRSRQGLDDDHDPDRARPCTGCPATNQSTSRSNSRIEGSAFGSGSPQSWFHVAPDAAPASALVLVAPGVAPILGLPAPDALESWSCVPTRNPATEAWLARPATTTNKEAPMYFAHCKTLTLSTALIALGIDGAAQTPAHAADSWSTPVLPPAGCGSFSGAQPNAVAVNAAGELALVGSLQTDAGFTVQICTSGDGRHWSGPSAIGQGIQPAVAIAPDGRIVVIWQWTS